MVEHEENSEETPDIATFDGLQMPFRITDPAIFRDACNYRPPKGDIVIASFPKSGN